MPSSSPPLGDLRARQFSDWYQEVIKIADLAEHSVARGCMVIKPWGYGIWEQIQGRLDRALKASGHENAYFPLLIPLSLLEKEAEHVEGFAKECAVVTHSRLEGDGTGLHPSSPLSEPYIIRPTSEAVVGATYSKWVSSYRDLPILVNQWANVFRWEMRTRLFVRTSEFLWQEGHTVHSTSDEAIDETLMILDIYKAFMCDDLCLPIVVGQKTPDERFPGAVHTFTVEGLMQDGKALQLGTSHYLGQNFSRAYDIKFQNDRGTEEYGWTTSWGVSTRLIGGLIMSLGDDYGLVIPPAVAPRQIVVVPVIRDQNSQAAVLEYAQLVQKSCEALTWRGDPVRVSVDRIGGLQSRKSPGRKWMHIKRGVPFVIEVGPREQATGTVSIITRHHPQQSDRGVGLEMFCQQCPQMLEDLQKHYQKTSQQRLARHIHHFDELKSMESYFKEDPRPGFARVPWCASAMRHPILAELGITPRVIPENQKPIDPGMTCIFTGQPADVHVIFARSY